MKQSLTVLLAALTLTAAAAPVQAAEVSGPRAEGQAGPCGSASGGSI